MPRELMGHIEKPIWTYAYRIVPAQSEQRLRAMKILLQAERVGARLRTRTFETRFVLERQTSDILVVTDSPDQKRDVNRRLEAELDRLNATFSVTVPLAVGDDGSISAEAEPHRDPE